MKKTILILFLSLPLVFASCEHQTISTGLDCNIVLDSGNTYYAGTPVKFNIDGDVDNIIFYSGEFGAEYRYRDRYILDTEEVESAIFTLNVMHRYGGNAALMQTSPALEIFYSNDFEGLSGEDGAADRAKIASMYNPETNELEGWTKLVFTDPGANSSRWWDPIVLDLKEAGTLDNFCLAMHWNPKKGIDPSPENTQEILYDTYWFNGDLEVDYKGEFASTSMTLRALADVTVMMSEEFEDPYYKNAGNGSIRLDDGTHDLIFSGGYQYNEYNNRNDPKQHINYKDLEGWVFTAPQQISKVENDKAVTVKNIQNSLGSYEYTWDEPGTYDVTFVCSSVDYLNSEEKVISMKVTILDTPVQKQ